MKTNHQCQEKVPTRDVKWEVDKHTKLDGPTDAYGELEFTGAGPSSKAKVSTTIFIRSFNYTNRTKVRNAPSSPKFPVRLFTDSLPSSTEKHDFSAMRYLCCPYFVFSFNSLYVSLMILIWKTFCTFSRKYGNYSYPTSSSL